MVLTNVAMIALLGATCAVITGYAIRIFVSARLPRTHMGGIMLLFGAEWILAELLEFVSPDVSMKIFWNNAMYVGIAGLPVAWAGFCRQYTGRQDLAQLRFYLTVGSLPLIFLALVSTNGLHEFMWSVVSVPAGSFGYIVKRNHAGFWIFIAYSYALIAYGAVKLVRMFVKSRHIYRRKTRAVLAGGVIALVASVLDASGIVLIKGLDVIPLAFSALCLILMYGFRRLRFSETAPLVYQAAIESLQESVFVLDAENRCLYANPAAYRIFPGLPPRRLGANLSEFCPELVPILELSSSAEGGRGDLTLGGRVFDVTVALLRDWQGRLVNNIAVLRDITHLAAAREELRRANEDLERKVLERTQALSVSNEALKAEIGERKSAEWALQNSLAEKEILLREIHHRVKNNLQVIMSLLRLPLREVADPRAASILSDTFNRVKSIATIHEILQQADDIARLPLSRYIRQLIESLVDSEGERAKDIAVSTDTEEARLGMDSGIVCGLLINELVSNSFRHAFPDGRGGKIWVRLSSSDDATTLTVGDDGVGFPEGIDPNRAESLGLKIVHALIRQLEGEMEFRGKPGAEFRISFCERKRPVLST